MAGADDTQRDEELAATDEDAAGAAARGDRLELHTALPGIVQAFDAATQTARVRLAIKRITRGGEAVAISDLLDCPVQFPRFGNFILTGPVAAGDECLVVFAERAFDNWFEKGGVQEPSEYRLHDYSDGFVIPGFSSRPKAGQVAGGAAGDALELRTLDGTTVLRIDADGKVYVGQKLLAQPTLLATTYRTAEGAMNAALVAALTALGVFAAAVVANPTELATFTATYPTIGALVGGFAAFVPLWLAAIQAFEAQAASFPTTKAMVR